MRVGKKLREMVLASAPCLWEELWARGGWWPGVPEGLGPGRERPHEGASQHLLGPPSSSWTRGTCDVMKAPSHSRLCSLRGRGMDHSFAHTSVEHLFYT